MPKLIMTPTRIRASGTKPKVIEEFVGLVNSGDDKVSIARMHSPAGWVEPGQTPKFDEFTLVLSGKLHVIHNGGIIEVFAGQAVITRAGEWIQYSTPDPGGADYISVCNPAFSPSTVVRDS